MQEQAFARYLAARYPQATINSYLAYCRRVERHLSIDLTICDLGDEAIDRIALQLAHGNGLAMPAKSARNCMAAVRHYAAFRAENTFAIPATTTASATAAQAPRPEHVCNATVRDLLILYGQVMDELRDRKVVRTANSPVGDYAEQLFARSFGWRLKGNSAAGHDAEGNGKRYQIKARRIAQRNSSRQLSAIRRLPQKTFDVLAAVLFDEHFAVLRAALIPHDVVEVHAKPDNHTNSWRFMLDDKVWLLPGVEDVTAQLKLAQAAF
jgi:hypothetical protein